MRAVLRTTQRTHGNRADHPRREQQQHQQTQGSVAQMSRVTGENPVGSRPHRSPRPHAQNETSRTSLRSTKVRLDK